LFHLFHLFHPCFARVAASFECEKSKNGSLVYGNERPFLQPFLAIGWLEAGQFAASSGEALK